jgi:hypothetical protein
LDWAPASERFAMVFAATARHWVDPHRALPQGEMLEPHGYLAAWGAGHVIPYDGDPFSKSCREIPLRAGACLRNRITVIL